MARGAYVMMITRAARHDTRRAMRRATDCHADYATTITTAFATACLHDARHHYAEPLPNSHAATAMLMPRLADAICYASLLAARCCYADALRPLRCYAAMFTRHFRYAAIRDEQRDMALPRVKADAADYAMPLPRLPLSMPCHAADAYAATPARVKRHAADTLMLFAAMLD